MTLKMLYAPDNPAGFRDWHWEEFKFIPGYHGSVIDKEYSIIRGQELKERKKLLAEKRKKLRENKKN